MKIALIADTFPPFRTSGAVQLRDLSREFARQGHELTVLLPDADLAEASAISSVDGIRVLRLRAPRTKDVNYLFRTINEWRMPYHMLRNLMRSSVDDRSWDGVVWYSPSIFFGPLVGALKLRSRCRGFLILRDIFPEWAVDLGLMRRGVAYHFFRLVALNQYRQADVIGVQTPGNMSYFEEKRRSVSASVEVLQNWLGAPGKAHCRIRVDATPLAGRKIMVYAGNMGVAQGMDTLIALAERLRERDDIGFLFVGRGSEVARLCNLAIDKGLDNVLFQDEVDPDEIPDLYRQCHVGLISLDLRHKSHNIPGKFLSYMQNGLPVLARSNPGNDLLDLIRGSGVGRATGSGSLDDLETECLALVAEMDTDPGFSARCAALFKERFAVAQAVRQIVAALGRP